MPIGSYYGVYCHSAGMVAADKLIHLLPAAGIPSGQRVEDHLANVGQQQWWESRESARLWKDEQPSVAGTLRLVQSLCHTYIYNVFSCSRSTTVT